MSPDLLHQALHDRLGHTLTPEVVQWIIAYATFEEDRTLRPGRFTPMVVGGRYVISVEPFRDVLPELTPLHEAHWLETERHRHGLALKPNLQYLLRIERAGRMVQFVIRDCADEVEGRPIVGHLRMYLNESLHTGTLFAEEDTLYVAPAHRGGQLGLQLLRYAEDVLVQLGVREIRANSKLVNNADVLMRRMRYTPVATQFVKMISKEPAHVQ